MPDETPNRRQLVSAALWSQAQVAWTRLREAAYAVSAIPLLVAAGAAWLLAEVGQVRELYLVLAEGVVAARSVGASALAPWLPLGFAVLSMLLLSTALYLASQLLGRHARESVFNDYQPQLVDPRLERWVNQASVIAAGAPWIGLACGVGASFSSALRHVARLTGLPGGPCPAPTGHGPAACYFAGGIDATLTGLGALAGIMRPAAWLLGVLPDFWIALGIWAGLVVARPAIVPIARAIAFWSRAGLRPRRRMAIALARGPSPDTDRHRASHRFLGGLQDFRHTAKRQLSALLGNLATFIAKFLVITSLAVPFAFGTLLPLVGPYLPGATEGLDLAACFACWKEALPEAVHPFATPFGLWAVATFAVLVAERFWHSRRRRLRSSVYRHPLVLAHRLVRVLLLGLLGWLVASGFATFPWVELARAPGPLATILIAVFVVLSLLVAMGMASNETSLPMVVVIAVVAFVVVKAKLDNTSATFLVIMAAITLIAGLIFRARRLRHAVSVMLLLFAISFASLMKPSASPVPPASPAAAPHPRPSGARAGARTKPYERDVVERFDEWYRARERARSAYGDVNPGKRYPVFIIAAEGGGIYAAAAVSTFLARLQERCPSFAQHVFAISAVSGGAVGASIFHGAVDAAEPGLVDEGCPRRGPRTPAAELEKEVADVIRQDHLSPIMGLVVPDILGAYSDRATGLRESLDAAMQASLARTAPAAAAAWPRLRFVDHWSPEKPAPALILNTTSVSLGNRVVFAPFLLERRELTTLNTFTGLGLDPATGWDHAYERTTLTEAAVVSARFPGVVAAHEIKSRDRHRWYFVDGGYVDASGALTARDVWETLQHASAARADAGRPWEIDLRLILLTSTQADRGGAAKEPQLRDVVAPIETVLAVRGLLSRIAVRETIAKVDPDAVDKTAALEDAAQRDGNAYGWSVTTIELNQTDIELPLGWQISRFTHEVVAAQLGRADLCRRACEKARQRRNAGGARHEGLEVARTIRANSCVMASVERLLGARLTTPSPAAQSGCPNGAP